MVRPAYGVAPIESLTNPNVWVRCSRRPCANRFGRYDKSAAATFTRSRVSELIRLPGTSFRTCDTVVVETPAKDATSLMVLGLRRSIR